MNDEKIIDLLLACDETAISEIERKYGESLSRVAESITRDRRDAEECVNDAYLALWRTAPDNIPRSPRAYLLKTVKNLSNKRVRSKMAAKRSADIYELTEYIADIREPWDEINASELRDAINGFYESLSPEDRIIFVRRHLYSDSYAMIGHRLGVSDKLVSVRLVRMKNKLRDHLTERGVIDMGEYEKPGKPTRKAETYVVGGKTCIFTPIRIDCREVGDFREGRAAVIRTDGRLGYIDRDGGVRVPFEYYTDGSASYTAWFMFHDGVAMVKNGDGKCGFIDRDGNIVIPFEYDGGLGNVFQHSKCFVIKNGVRMLINKNNEIVEVLGRQDWHAVTDGTVMRASGLAGSIRDGKFGFTDREGNVVLPFEYDYEPEFTEDGCYGYSEGLTAVRKNGKWGYADMTGREVVEPTLEYDSVSMLYRGQSLVTRGTPEQLPVLPGERSLEYAMREAREWRAVVRYGAIDKNGRELAEPVYECAEMIWNNDKFTWLFGRAGEYRLLSVNGTLTEVFTDCNTAWDSIEYDSNIDLFKITKDGKRGYIGYDGAEILPPVYEEVDCLDRECGFVRVKSGGKCSVCGLSGEPLLPFVFDEIGLFDNGAAIAKKDGAYGILKIE